MWRLLALLAVIGGPALLGCAAPAQAEDAYRLGVAALAQGERDTAASWFRQAAAQDPSLLEAHLNLAAIALAEDRANEAIAHLEPLQTADTTQDPRVRYLHALALLQTGEDDSALELLRRLDAENFPEAAFLLGQQAYLAGDQGEAEAFFRRYLILRPEGGFGAEATAQLADLASALADDLEAAADAALDPPAAPEPASLPAADAEPAPPPDAEPAPSVAEPAPRPKPSKSTPKTTPGEPPLTDEEKAWRDARFLEIVKHEYARAIGSYRRYLQLAPFGEHATAAQEGIVRCEAALKQGDA